MILISNLLSSERMKIHTFINPHRLSNSYLLELNLDIVVLVDVGDFDTTNLLIWLQKEGKKLTHVILTHEHADHSCGLDDLYKITDLFTVKIAPLVDWKMDDVSVYMKGTNQYMSCDGFFENTKKYTIFDSMEDYWKYGKPCWIGTDNQILREFFVKTMGDFSGYVSQS